jgi:hypothetical protein
LQDPIINIPASAYEDPAKTASQLSLLLDAARGAVDEEFKRTERIEAKARNQTTFTATLFAGAQVLVVGLINGVLTDGGNISGFIPWLAAVGGIATLVAMAAFAASYRVWSLREESTVALSDMSGSDYIGAAIVGNPRVGINLVLHYSEIASDRQTVNDDRVRRLTFATTTCFLSNAVVAAEIALAFVAVAVR